MGAMKSQITSPTIFLLNRLFGRRSKETSKLRVTGLCADNLPMTGEFPTQMASNAEHISIWWRQHVSNDTQAPLSSGEHEAFMTWKYFSTLLIHRPHLDPFIKSSNTEL